MTKNQSSNVDINQIGLRITSYYSGQVHKISLTEWMKIGPGIRWGIGPHKAVNSYTGQDIPFSLVPVAYRNNYISHILISLGILDYPWADNAQKFNIPVNLERFEDTSFLIQLFGNCIIDEANRTVIIERFEGKYAIRAPEDLKFIPVRIFEHSKLALTNSSEILQKGWLPQQDTEKLILLDGRVDFTHPTIDEYIDELIPDKAFGEVVHHEHLSIGDNDTAIVVVDSPKHHLSVTVSIHRLWIFDELPDYSLWLRLVGISALHQSEGVVSDMKHIYESLYA